MATSTACVTMSDIRRDRRCSPSKWTTWWGWGVGVVVVGASCVCGSGVMYIGASKDHSALQLLNTPPKRTQYQYKNNAIPIQVLLYTQQKGTGFTPKT